MQLVMIKKVDDDDESLFIDNNNEIFLQKGYFHSR